jgi:hypothetical protein
LLTISIDIVAVADYLFHGFSIRQRPTTQQEAKQGIDTDIVE